MIYLSAYNRVTKTESRIGRVPAHMSNWLCVLLEKGWVKVTGKIPKYRSANPIAIFDVFSVFLPLLSSHSLDCCDQALNARSTVPLSPPNQRMESIGEQAQSLIYGLVCSHLVVVIIIFLVFVLLFLLLLPAADAIFTTVTVFIFTLSFLLWFCSSSSGRSSSFEILFETFERFSSLFLFFLNSDIDFHIDLARD